MYTFDWEESQNVAQLHLYAHTALRNTPASQLKPTLAFLTVLDEEDMVSVFSPPILWKPSCSMIALLKSALSTDETFLVPTDKHS